MENTTEKITFDPTKSYSWAHLESIPMNRNEFGTIYSTLNTLVSSPGFQQDLEKANRTLATARLHQVLTDAIKRNVEDGVIVEVATPEQPADTHPEHQMD